MRLIVLCITSIISLSSYSLAVLGNRNCGLPSDYSNFPHYIQEQLNVIWKGYIATFNCDEKVKLTDDVIRIHNDIEKHLSKNKKAVAFGEKNTSLQEEVVPQIQTQPPPMSLQKPQPQEFGIKSHELRNDKEFLEVKKDIPGIKAGYKIQPAHSYVHGNSNNYHSNSPPYQTAFGDDEDAPGPYLNTDQATFLKYVNSEVKDMFLRLFFDVNIPSEGLRDHKLHMLAVSMLDSKTLTMFDTWAVARRKALKDLEAHTPKKLKLA
uniref:DUF148 domain-containing protein n=1 Tax=Rhabditophanes sp. KR3021 TaxID=114890 RepID=A0AC35U5N2_9BILA